MEEIKVSENILEHEEALLFIVQKYLNKNRYFTIENIIPFINANLKKLSINLNYQGIREILKSLIKKKLILERSKLMRDEILDNENRERIFNLICKNPGIYFNRITKKLNLSNYILAWHLKMLIKFNFIRSKRIENHEVFFDINLPPENDEMYSFMSKEKSRKIINYLLENQEGITKTKLSKELTIHSSTISKYVDRLEIHKILLKKKLTNKTLYFINEEFYYSVGNL